MGKINWLLLLKFLPRNLLSRVVGVLVQIQRPQIIVDWMKRVFINYYRINMSEAEKSFAEYKSIGEVFTRRLRPGLRTIAEGIVSPADSTISQIGRVSANLLVQAKGLHYSVRALIPSEKWNSCYQDGSFYTFYLCPTDYHRVHVPVDGTLLAIEYVPGTLWPVNELSVRSIPNLFAINERLNFHFSTPSGKVTLVMVGATNVGKMSTAFDSTILTNQWSRTGFIREVNHSVNRGDELGTFHMGSTVILLVDKNFQQNLGPSSAPLGPIKMGQCLQAFRIS